MAKRAKHYARKAVSGAKHYGGMGLHGLKRRLKPRAIGGAVGVATELVEDYAAKELQFIATKWWGGPLATLGASLIFPDKYGDPMAGAAGYEAGFNYKLKQFQDGKRDTSPVRDFRDKPAAAAATAPAAAAAPNAQGEDAGLEMGARRNADAGLMFS